MKVLLLLAIMLNVGCGLSSPKHVDYVDESADKTDTTSQGGSSKTDSGTSTTLKGCDAAISTFASAMKPAIQKSNCASSSCHANQTIAGGKLSESDDTLNRATLKAYTNGDADKLINKITTGPHSGGNLSSTMPAAKIKSWQTAEADCK